MQLKKYLLRVYRKIVTSQDETGELADSFNKMTKELRDTMGKLEKSEEKYRTLIETAYDGIITSDKKYLITEFNKRAERIYGYTRDEIIGKSVETIVSPEHFKQHENMLKKFLKENSTSFRGETFEEKGIKKDGKEVPLEISYSILGDKDDYSITAIVRDITDRVRREEEHKKAEEKVKDSENRLRTIFENARDAIFIADAETGKIVDCNLKSEELLDRSKSDIIGMHQTGLHPPEDAKSYADMFGEHVKKGMSEPVTAKVIRKDGSLVDVEINANMLEIGGRKLIQGIFRDISERQKAEELIKKEKDFSESIIENADVVIIGLDLDAKVTLFNKKAEDITGYSRAEVMGKDWFRIISFKEGKVAFGKAVQEILNNKVIQPFESSFINKRGEEKTIYSRGAPLKDEEGRIIGILGIGEDITEKRKLESQLTQSEKLRALGELAGGVAHNLNNVLAVILGRTQLLRMTADKPPKVERRKSILAMKQGLEVIEKATTDGAETVRRIQEFSRIRSDDRNFEQLDLNQIIDHALEFTKVRWKDDAERKGIHVDILKDTSALPPILGSASELREVFINLINNASDAMPKGGRLTIRSYKENNHVTITLEDTGEGIPAEITDKIFDPFFTTKGPQSTGLGMSVSYSIISRHKGTITVDSTEGQGTTFTIKIPIAERMIKKEIAKEFPGKIKKAKILVIEDDEEVRQLLFDILSSKGHKVTIASHGKEGIDIFQKKHFDIVLTDLGMPRLSGWEVTKAIKELDPDSIVILVSGWGIQIDDAMVKNYKVDFIINKPFRMDQILKIIQQAMETKERKRK